jgi:hypothetical protein
MRNLTLRIDDELLDRARRYAAGRGTTVARIVRDHLASVTGADDRAERARLTLIELAERAQSRAADWTWNREDIYAGRLSRFKHHFVRGAAADQRAGEGSGRSGFSEDD